MAEVGPNRADSVPLPREEKNSRGQVYVLALGVSLQTDYLLIMIH